MTANTIKLTKSEVAIGLVALFCLAIGVYRYVDHIKQEKAVAQLEAATTKQLADSLIMRLTSTYPVKDSLEAALKAANTLNGELIAAVRLHVLQRDTVVKHDSLPTAVAQDQGRVAQFEDSTFAGTIKGIVTAPPYPAPLGIQYQLVRPPFDPTIAFVRVGNRTAVAVNWRGEKVQVIAPYAKEPPKREPWAGGFAELDYTPLFQQLYAAAGGRVKIMWNLQVNAGINTRGEVFTRLRKEF